MPATSPIVALPSPAASTAGASLARIIASAFSPGVPLPAASSSSAVSQAFALPSQDNLDRPAPPNCERILPTRPPPPLQDVRSRPKPYAAIPLSQTGGHPLITTDMSAYATHSIGQDYGGFYTSFPTYAGALGHIIKHFANPNRPIPRGLCLNCFLFHHPHPCQSPTYDWNNHLSPSHPTCLTCGRHHFPPCNPTRE